MRKLFTLILLGLMVACSPKKEPIPQTKYTDQQLGQLLIVGFRGTEINKDTPIVQQIKEYNIGGVILYDYDIDSKSDGRNITDPNQLLKLSSALVAYSSTPPIISIYQEGGKVNQLQEKYGFPKSVTAKYLGEIDDKDSTQFYARKMAQEFMVVGVNTNFAPVLDVNTHPGTSIISKNGRSFSSNPTTVIEHAGYMLDEFDKEGILTVIKHFPGYGSSKDDATIRKADVTETWTDVELKLYQTLFASRQINAVMTAHTYNANIDSLWPATLSSSTINGLLRDSLGFGGVVISDDMQMAAIIDHYELDTALEQAMNAGVDMFLFGNNLKYDEHIAENAIHTMQKLIANNRVSEATVDSALARVGRLKKNVIEDLCTCLTF